MSKPATKPAHPSYSAMIIASIAALKERSGSSRQAIVGYIQDNYVGIGPNCSKMVTKTTKNLIENGKVKNGSGGSYRFALTEAGKAKPAKAKKPAAKKPAAKKPAAKKETKSKKPAAKKPAVKKAKKAGTKKGAKTPTKKTKSKSPAKKTGKKPTPKKTAKKPAAKKSQKK